MNKKQTKKQIKVIVEEISPYDFDQSLGATKLYIEKLISQHGSDAQMSWNSNHWHQYDDSPTPQFELSIRREETDEEYNKRISAAKEEALRQEEHEHKEFLRLSAKFK